MPLIIAAIPFLVLAYFLRIGNVSGGTCIFIDPIGFGPACFGVAFFVPWAIRLGVLAIGIVLIVRGIRKMRESKT